MAGEKTFLQHAAIFSSACSARRYFETKNKADKIRLIPKKSDNLDFTAN